MATKTIDILLNLKTDKGKSIDDLTGRFKQLENRAASLKKGIEAIQSGTWLGRAGEAATARVNRLQGALNSVEQEMKQIHAEASKRTLEKNLDAAKKQADGLREKMERVAQVGARVGAVGAAIVAPFALAVKKYVETAGETEDTSRRILDTQNKWADVQVRIGRVAAEQLLPTLEKALTVVEKIADFAEQNPGAVKAAIGIGGSLVTLGGFLVVASQIVSTIATVQGLLAGAGIGGGAVAGAGASAAALTSAVTAGISAALPALGVVAAVVVAAEATRRLMNWALGTDNTWADLLNTLKQLVFIVGEGWKALPGGMTEVWKNNFRQLSDILSKLGRNLIDGIGSYFTQLASRFYDGLVSFGDFIASGFASVAQAFSRLFDFLPGRADGGYISKGVFMGGERGREFVLSNSTTRRAEGIVGSQLTQQSLLSALAGGRGITLNDNRRFDANISPADRRAIREETMRDMVRLLGAIG